MIPESRYHLIEKTELFLYRFGTPLRDDLSFLVLEISSRHSSQAAPIV